MAPTLHLDGAEVSFTEGDTILTVLRHAQVDLPALCYEPRLPPQASCRLCLVQIGGRPGFFAACTTLAEAGTGVTTESDALREYRRTILELVLSETPPAATCPRCSLLGPCSLHDAAGRYGAHEDAMPRLPGRDPSADPNPFIQRDYRWCIACYRCVRVCRDWEMASAITVSGRGQGISIASFPADRLLESPCTFCGQCINTCPTSALMDRKLLARLEPGADQSSRRRA